MLESVQSRFQFSISMIFTGEPRDYMRLSNCPTSRKKSWMENWKRNWTITSASISLKFRLRNPVSCHNFAIHKLFRIGLERNFLLMGFLNKHCNNRRVFPNRQDGIQDRGKVNCTNIKQTKSFLSRTFTSDNRRVKLCSPFTNSSANYENSNLL